MRGNGPARIAPSTVAFHCSRNEEGKRERGKEGKRVTGKEDRQGALVFESPLSFLAFSPSFPFPLFPFSPLPLFSLFPSSPLPLPLNPRMFFVTAYPASRGRYVCPAGSRFV